MNRLLPLFRAALLLTLAACAGSPTPTTPPAAPTPVPQTTPTAAAAATPGPEGVADLEAALPTDPAITIGRLDNGLTYYVRANRRPQNRAELWLAVDAGSMQEDDDQLGLAHFVEHMAFNGTRNFEKLELLDYLERLGMRFGPDVNAFTSFDETVYLLKVPTDEPDTLERAFQILQDWAQGIAFEGEEIDKERGVVVEEWRLGRGADARIRDRQFPVLFQGSRYAERLPIGDVEILRSAPHEALRRFYRAWYRPELMALVAVGDFDPDAITGLIRRYFAPLVNPAEPRPRRSYPVPEHEETLYALITDPEAAQTRVGVYYKLERRPQGRVRDYRRQLLEQLYHGMVNQRLDEVRRRPEPPFVFAISTSAGFVRTRDVYLQAAQVEEGGVERGLEALLTEVERVDRHGFTAGELERMKAELLRRYEQAWAERDKLDSGMLAAEYLRNFLDEEPLPGIERELALVRELLPTIGLEELNRLAAQWISESNRVVLVSGPENAASPLPSEARLAALFEEVEERPVEPYVDRIAEAPLLAAPPAPGPVVAESAIPEVGITEWRLANGVRVVLKPTDFQNDEVLLAGFSPGGHSLAADDEHASALFADTVAAEGGLGELDRVALEKLLAGKVVEVRPYVDELEEGLRGRASPRDLETMLQLVYLSFTAPRRDPEAFAAFQARTRSFLENRQSRPEAAFADEMTRVLSRNHPRRRPPSVELLAEVELEAALRFYKERFADAGDFTFLLVGNFDPAAIRPLVETYLGGLPATGREETWRDVGVEAPEGVVEVEVRRGLEPKSLVQLVFEGPAEWSRENYHDLRSLADALRIRLREVLREDLGATYGVGVRGVLSARPHERYTLTISFGCAPENVEPLLAAVWRELAAARAGELDAGYAEKVREIQLRERETDLRENPFWLAVLETYYDHGWDPRLVLDFDALLARVTPDRLADSARRFLDPADYVVGVLYPEGESGSGATGSGSGSATAGAAVKSNGLLRMR